MRILVLSNLYPDARLPAFGTFVAGHVEALRRVGATVDVIAIRGVPAHAAVLRKYAVLSLRGAFAALILRLRRRSPAIVEAHVAYPTGVPAWLAARIGGGRLVLYSHGTDVTGAGSGFHARLAGRLFRGADMVVANSAFIAGQLASRFRVDARRVAVISPGIDFKRFSEGASTRGRTGILFVGRLSAGKGAHELVRAVAMLEHPTELRFVGDGPERVALEREAASLAVSARFDGSLPPREVAAAMQDAAIVAMPSTYPEGLGLVALEAMAAGALVVASKIGGLPESVIDGETGWLVPPGDVDALASALADALAVAQAAPSQRRATLLRAASAKALSQDVDAMARETMAAYERLLAR